LIVVLLIIGGCDQGGREGSITGINIYTGTEGLTAEFFNVPDDVFESTEDRESSFRVNVELENKGAYPSEGEELTAFVGYLALGIEDDYMEVLGWAEDEWIYGEVIEPEGKQAKFKLRGKTIDNPLGGRGIISVDVGAKNIRDNQSEKHDTDILMTTCYKYQTKAVPTVCVDTTQYGFKEKEKSCEIEDISLTGQGAPVAVTKIGAEMLPEGADTVKPMFTIYVENKGNGIVVGDSQEIIEKACSEKSLEHDKFELNYVSITAKLGGKGDMELECSPRAGLIRLKDKKGMVRCTLNDAISKDEGTYTTPLQIILDYGYMFTVSKKVTVKRVLTY
jgi:hypothetical protein